MMLDRYSLHKESIESRRGGFWGWESGPFFYGEGKETGAAG
jgi:hypothetical protein